MRVFFSSAPQRYMRHPSSGQINEHYDFKSESKSKTPDVRLHRSYHGIFVLSLFEYSEKFADQESMNIAKLSLNNRIKETRNVPSKLKPTLVWDYLSGCKVGKRLNLKPAKDFAIAGLANLTAIQDKKEYQKRYEFLKKIFLLMTQ